MSWFCIARTQLGLISFLLPHVAFLKLLLALSNMLATGHLCLLICKLLLIKIKINIKLSHASHISDVQLATSILDNADIGSCLPAWRAPLDSTS